MAEYTLEVTTGSMLQAGTFDNLYVTLIGTERQSERTQLTSFGLDEKTGKVGTYSVTTLLSLGCLLLLKLEKDPFHESPEKDWFCSKIVVKTPEEDEILFPCHSWLSRGEFVIFPLVRNHILYVPEYVSEHWEDDDFFGYQILNGATPFMIKRCSKLPSNFPVTEEMVKPFLANGVSLTEEMKKGNIFINDYKIMDGLPTRVIDGKPVALTAALCLLYLNPEKKLLPITIQLGQQPSEETPIFLPSDLKSDWLLAKIYVRNADTLYNQVISHLQNTHLLAEVFTMATLRNLPMIHPLHKLLIPHHRYTLHINILARARLYGPGRLFGNTSLGADGVTELMKRGLSEMTYTSLCLPENIAARGLESIPDFYYRDDALRLWSITNSFVKAMVAYYYPSDSEVSADSELQEWINEIFYYGFLGNSDSGIPSSFQTVAELIKFVTMVIFTSSVQHAAVGSAQFDFLGWTPNAPLLLFQAPPTTKGQSSMEAILATLPNKSFVGVVMSNVWQLSRKYSDFVPLGTYPEQRFEEPAALQMIEDFQAELSSLSVAINKRNSELELPYTYLNPKEIENSVTI
uniref:Arachidonate 15-lipoxygenase B-like n=1 Tax=Sander lucioperca TaxID=283035 RepID=A0A8D0AA92_SANLU